MFIKNGYIAIIRRLFMNPNCDICLVGFDLKGS